MTEQSSASQQAPALLQTVELSTGPEPRWSVIWLHGLGADGHDFEPVVPHLGLDGGEAVRFVFPHAQRRPVTINQGMVMRAWYDIAGINLRRDQDQAGIGQSAAQIDALLEREESRGVPAERCILAGFSQGGAMALHVGLRYPRRLAGLIALSCYLLSAERLEAEHRGEAESLPIFAGHGQMDPVVPFPLGEDAASRLRDMGHPVTWRAYPIQHAVSAEEIADIGRFIRDRRQAGDG